MPDVVVRDVPEAVLNALTERAAEHGRSLQQELLALLESVAAPPRYREADGLADAIRERLSREGRVYSDSTPLVREDRER